MNNTGDPNLNVPAKIDTGNKKKIKKKKKKSSKSSKKNYRNNNFEEEVKSDLNTNTYTINNYSD